MSPQYFVLNLLKSKHSYLFFALVISLQFRESDIFTHNTLLYLCFVFLTDSMSSISNIVDIYQMLATLLSAL